MGKLNEAQQHAERFRLAKERLRAKMVLDVAEVIKKYDRAVARHERTFHRELNRIYNLREAA
jgi:hypothetical protein